MKKKMKFDYEDYISILPDGVFERLTAEDIQRFAFLLAWEKYVSPLRFYPVQKQLFFN